MKYLSFFVLAFILGACNNCRYVDCYPSGLEFRFRVVNSSGKDLVHDLNVVVDSLHLRSSSGREERIEFQGSADKSLDTFLSPDVLTYTLSYDGRSTEITISIEKINDGPCCGPLYEATEVNTTNGKAPVELSIPNEHKIHVITL